MTFVSMLEAARSGKRVRKGTTGAFVLASTITFSYEDTQYAGWEVETEIAKSIVLSQLKAAWDSSVPTSGSVAKSDESSMFTRLAVKLGLATA